jgi:hypothetical protein
MRFQRLDDGIRNGRIVRRIADEYIGDRDVLRPIAMSLIGRRRRYHAGRGRVSRGGALGPVRVARFGRQWRL